MQIQNISSTPKYISDFINHNFTKLIEIYDNGISENNSTGRTEEKDFGFNMNIKISG